MMAATTLRNAVVVATIANPSVLADIISQHLRVVRAHVVISTAMSRTVGHVAQHVMRVVIQCVVMVYARMQVLIPTIVMAVVMSALWETFVVEVYVLHLPTQALKE
jgi:hypothetical protein